MADGCDEAARPHPSLSLAEQLASLALGSPSASGGWRRYLLARRGRRRRERVQASRAVDAAYRRELGPEGLRIVDALFSRRDYRLDQLLPDAVRAARLGADRRGLDGEERRRYLIEHAALIADHVDWIVLHDCGRMGQGATEAVAAYLDAA